MELLDLPVHESGVQHTPDLRNPWIGKSANLGSIGFPEPLISYVTLSVIIRVSSDTPTVIQHEAVRVNMKKAGNTDTPPPR